MIFTKHGGNMKKANKFKYKRVRIYWQDPTSNPEWMTVKKALEENYSWCDDIGYLLFKDQRRVIIFASHSFDDDGELTVGNTTVYPRSVVKKIEVFKMTHDKMFEEIGCPDELKKCKAEIKRQKNL